MSKYVIEKGVPVVSVARKGAVRKESTLKDTMCRMGVGDSFLATNSRATISSTASVLKREFSDRVYITRSVDGGVRVWRVA